MAGSSDHHFVENLENGKTFAQVKGEVVRAASIHLVICRRGGTLMQRNHPVIVLRDPCDKHKSPPGSSGIRLRHRQKCSDGLLVHEKVQYELIKKLARRVEGYRPGQGINESAIQGPIVNAAAVQKLDALVKGAPEIGAVIHTGDKFLEDLKIYSYEPTFIRSTPGLISAAGSPIGDVNGSGLGREAASMVWQSTTTSSP
ncbi:uncharacterized protein LY79DRAFT_581316 [Colletotrichum navitas]|uniref:Aldehyde dehydrogenase domain-containing protein n=1 Tax=Colletotrichum navitas TaxID=681940 RepID=A0AAD8PVK2_9PEZI|nr:uncharacterized protein LY79DRAFT_581316 [Colletotrichum navitas]KAK1585028.1 hypothetical protein LY79DRAFT_581316 [Colletotrichum navitas]